MRGRSTPSSYGAPPAGADAAGPRPDLRGFRGATAALIERVERQLLARRVHGLVAGFVAGLIVGLALLGVGVPGVLTVLLAAATNLAVTVALPPLLISPADRRLLSVVNRMATAAQLAWRHAYGTSPIPRTEEAQLLWIAAQPDTSTDPEAIAIEGSFLLFLGRYDAARERAQRIPEDTPRRRFDRALAFAAIEFDSGGRGDLTEARAAAEAVKGPRRPNVVVALALEEAGRAVIRGDDWGPIIGQAASTVGSPVMANIGTALGRAMPILPWLLVSEVALGAVLYLVTTRALA